MIGSGTSGTVVVNNPQTITAVAGGTNYDDSPYNYAAYTFGATAPPTGVTVVVH